MKNLSKLLAFILTLSLVYCGTNNSKKYITDVEVLLMTKNLMGYNDKEMGLNTIFYNSVYHYIFPSSRLNSKILDYHPNATKLNLVEVNDSIFFVKYLRKELNDNFNRNSKKKYMSKIYVSDIWMTNDTIVFCIAKANFGETNFYVKRKDLSIINYSVKCFY